MVKPGIITPFHLCWNLVVSVPLSEEKNRFVYKPTKESVAGGSFIFSSCIPLNAL